MQMSCFTLLRRQYWVYGLILPLLIGIGVLSESTVNAFPVRTFTPTYSATPLPTWTLTPTLTYTPNVTSTPERTRRPTRVVSVRTPVSAQTSTPVSSNMPCPNAPPTYVRIGDTVVVDLDSRQNATRIMTADLCGANCTIAQAYDDEQMTIIRGPQCGQYRSRNVWYWYVHHPRLNIWGWTLEGVQGDRWLCSLDNPNCGR
jgi:hypothetical protein